MGESDRNGLTLTVVGSGTASPEPDRVSSGYLVSGAGFRLLLDCGPGVVHHLARFGLDWPGLTHLALTHFHNDHVGDVSTLLFAHNYGLPTPRTDPLVIIGPPGTDDFLERLGAALGDHVRKPAFPIEVIESEGGDRGKAMSIGEDARLTVHRTRHTDRSVAYRLDTGHGTIAYAGDTGYDEGTAAFLAGADVLIMECALPDDHRALDIHLTPRRAAAMAAIARPELLLLTHIYPVVDRDRVPELVREAGWSGRIRIAYDGLRIPLSAGPSRVASS